MLAGAVRRVHELTSAELSALTSTTVVDVLRRLPGHVSDERRDVWTSRVVTVIIGRRSRWASRSGRAALGTLVEAVNIPGSLFYGTILGIFLCAFYLKRVGGHAVFAERARGRGGRGRVLHEHEDFVPLVQ